MRCADIAEQRPEDRYALHDDGACDFGGVPDGRHTKAPEVPFVLGITFVFPLRSNRRLDGNDHALLQASDSLRSGRWVAGTEYQRHYDAESNLL